MGLMHDDLAIKRKKLVEHEQRENIASPVPSRFFGNNATPGPSRLGSTPKDDGVLVTQEVVLVADSDDPEEVEDAGATDEEPDQVSQEDGYLSPASSLKRLSTPDVSSPPRPLEASRVFCRDSSTRDFAVDVLSSPESRKPVVPLRSQSLSRRDGKTVGCSILVPDTPRKFKPVNSAGGANAEVLCGPDLFDDADSMEIADFSMPPCSFGGSTQSSSGLDTPISQEAAGVATCEEDFDFGDDIEFIKIQRAKQDAVAQGWWTKWARGGAGNHSSTKDESRHGVSLIATHVHAAVKVEFFGLVEAHFTCLQKFTPLRRRETTVTSDGLHGALRFSPNGNSDGDKKVPTNRRGTRQNGAGRRSLIFSESAHSVELIRRRRSTGMAESGMSVVG
jgi:hypothetical protein